MIILSLLLIFLNLYFHFCSISTRYEFVEFPSREDLLDSQDIEPATFAVFSQLKKNKRPEESGSSDIFVWYESYLEMISKFFVFMFQPIFASLIQLFLFCFFVVPLHLIPLSTCVDPVNNKQYVEVVVLKKSKITKKLEFVSAIVDGAGGIKNTENTFMASITKALGVGATCDFGASVGVYFNQFFRPYIRYTYFCFCITHVFKLSFNLFFHFLFFDVSQRGLNEEKLMVSKMAMQYSAKLQTMVFCHPNNYFLDKTKGILNSDETGLVFNEQTFLNSCK